MDAPNNNSHSFSELCRELPEDMAILISLRNNGLNNYSEKVLSSLEETADYLFCHQSGLCRLIDHAIDSCRQDLIIMLSANHTLDIVFRKAIESQHEVNGHTRSFVERQQVEASLVGSSPVWKIVPVISILDSNGMR
jgi:hypothetical protein